MTTLGTQEIPARIAIVGSGPGGFYAAEHLLKSEQSCLIDMYDRLPTPFGLVRGGVAPDHAKIRNVTKVYEKIAAREGFRFFGNVTVGRDVTVDELREHYDAILFSYGAETDRRLGIHGEDLEGSYTATSFVGWYNGHPDYRDLTFDLSGEVAVIIGVGNVAMDVARILAKSVDELKATDIAAHALDALAESKIREIHLVGRRGPAQAAFTAAELKEMGELALCQPVVDPQSLRLNALSEAELSNNNTARVMELLGDYAAATRDDKPRKMYFRFLESPIAIYGTDRVDSIVLGSNYLAGTEPFKQWAEATGESTTLPCDLLFRSIGYRGVPMPGVPFDEKKGLIPNVDGRVEEEGGTVPGLYVAGWIKRGPTGIIGTNKPDSYSTAARLLEDLPTLPHCPVRDPEAIPALLEGRSLRYVSMGDWQKIDAAEQARGVAVGKPRERFTRIDEMLEVLG